MKQNLTDKHALGVLSVVQATKAFKIRPIRAIRVKKQKMDYQSAAAGKIRDRRGLKRYKSDTQREINKSKNHGKRILEKFTNLYVTPIFKT